MKYNVWTQGINFAFKAGDMLYRNSQEYQKGNPALQVKYAEDAGGTQVEKLNRGVLDDSGQQEVKEQDDNTTSETYYPGIIIYEDFEHDNQKIKITQFDFVKMLIGI